MCVYAHVEVCVCVCVCVCTFKCVCVCVCVCVYTKLLVQIKSLGVFSEDLKVIESLQHSTRNYHSNVYFLKNYTYESLATYNLMQVAMFT